MFFFLFTGENLQYFCTLGDQILVHNFAIQIQYLCKFSQNICNFNFLLQFECKKFATLLRNKFQNSYNRLQINCNLIQIYCKLKISKNLQKFCMLTLQNFCDQAQKMFNHNSRFLNLNYYFEGYNYSIDCCSCLDCCSVVSFQMLQLFL